MQYRMDVIIRFACVWEAGRSPQNIVSNAQVIVAGTTIATAYAASRSLRPPIPTAISESRIAKGMSLSGR